MILVLVAHGTRSAPARGVIGAIVAGVQERRPELDVRLAHVDVQTPDLAGVMGRIRADGERAVVVPLLLSTGFHVDTDIAGATDPRLDVVAPTLAGSSVLVDIAIDRVAEAMAIGSREGNGAKTKATDALVVAATGSSRPAARREVNEFAVALSERTGLAVTVGWAAGDDPDVGAAVGSAGAQGRVAVVSYLIGPGVFAAKIAAQARAAGAVAVGEPFGADPRLIDLVVRRYDDALTDPHSQ